MEKSDSTRKVTPYELATLASRIDPARCASDPEGAIAAAQMLLRTAQDASLRAEKEAREDEEDSAAEDEMIRAKLIDWVRGIKNITGERRRDRATRCFTKFMEHELPGTAKQELTVFKRDGFSDLEVHDLELRFTDWKKQPKRKKAKQGRRISDHDGRLRTPLGRLLPTKPRKSV